MRPIAGLHRAAGDRELEQTFFRIQAADDHVDDRADGRLFFELRQRDDPLVASAEIDEDVAVIDLEDRPLAASFGLEIAGVRRGNAADRRTEIVEREAVERVGQFLFQVGRESVTTVRYGDLFRLPSAGVFQHPVRHVLHALARGALIRRSLRADANLRGRLGRGVVRVGRDILGRGTRGGNLL